jgi:hypothetical protein
MAIQIQITRDFTLRDIEKSLSDLASNTDSVATIWLPHDIGPKLFKDCRLVTLLLTASRGRKLVVKDWIRKSQWDSRKAIKRFGTEIEGLASLVYANAVGIADDNSVYPDRSSILSAVIGRGGILEEEEGLGKSVTICAFDATDPELLKPLIFRDLSSKATTIEDLAKLRNQQLEKGISEDYSERVNRVADQTLGAFVYELFQNTFEHGRLDRQNSIVRGLRYVRLKKHIATNRADFLHRAEGYPELQAYLSTRVPAQGSFKFYEIAIGDQGLGIIGRFLSTRPDFNNPTTSSERASLVNQIIDQALSSKRGRSGAGYGLRNALRAVRELDGFLSLRTDALWLHWSPSASEALRLTPVSGMSELAHVQGTHFSMLFPFAFARHL